MTRASRGISPIQEKARGNDMKAKNVSVKKTKVSVKKPLDSMSVGAASSLPMGPSAGLRPGGMCKGGMAKKGYFKGGSVDGCVEKGKTRGKFV